MMLLMFLRKRNVWPDGNCKSSCSLCWNNSKNVKRCSFACNYKCPLIMVSIFDRLVFENTYFDLCYLLQDIKQEYTSLLRQNDKEA